MVLKEISMVIVYQQTKTSITISKQYVVMHSRSCKFGGNKQVTMCHPNVIVGENVLLRLLVAQDMLN